MKTLIFKDWCDDSRSGGVRKVEYKYQYINQNGKVLFEGSIDLPQDTENFGEMNNNEFDIFMTKIRNQFFEKMLWK